jgi:hypothetical protein
MPHAACVARSCRILCAKRDERPVNVTLPASIGANLPPVRVPAARRVTTATAKAGLRRQRDDAVSRRIAAVRAALISIGEQLFPGRRATMSRRGCTPILSVTATALPYTRL